MDKGMRLMLAPKSRSALPTDNCPIVTRIVKLLGSHDFSGMDFWMIALHPASSSTVSSSVILLLFVRNSFMNLAYVGIFSNASEKGMLIWSFLKISKKREYYFSLSFLMVRLDKEDVELVDDLVQLFLCWMLAISTFLLYSFPSLPL